MPLPVVAAGAAAPALWPWYAAMGAAGISATAAGLEGIRRGLGRGRPYQGPPAPASAPAPQGRSERDVYSRRMGAQMGGGRGSRSQPRPAASQPDTYVQPGVGTFSRSSGQFLGSGTYSQPGVGTFDRATGAMVRPAAPAASAPAASVPASVSAPVGYGPPPVLTTPASANRRSEVNRMITQGGGQPLPPPVDLKPYWAQNPEIKRAADEGPRAGQVGYSDRADIQEWMNAMNKTESGRAMVNRFLEQQRAKGLIQEDTTADFTPTFSQQQLAEVDAVQSPAFSQGRDRILGMRGSLAEAPAINDQYQAGFQGGDPVNWDAAMNARLPLPGGPNAQRRQELNRILEVPEAMVDTPPSADPRWAAGYQQGPGVNWSAAANSQLNVPGMSGNVNQPSPTAAGYGANPGVNWDAAMNAELDTPPVRGDALTMGERYNDPDEQRRMAAGFLGNRIQGLQRYFRGAQ